MGSCAPLVGNIFVDCEFPPARSQSIAYLINYDDILYVEFDGYPLQEIRTIAEHRDIIKLYLKAGTYIYSFEGKNNTVESGYYEFELLYADVFAHWVDLKVFDSTAEIKEQIEKLPKGKYVLIVGNEVYGLFAGVVLTEKERNSSDENQNTFYSLSFETDVEQSEPHLPQKYLGDITWLQTDHCILWDCWWDDSGIWCDNKNWCN